MDTEEARGIYKELKSNGGKLALKAADAIAWAMSQIPKEQREIIKEKGLHPLRRVLILCCQKKVMSEVRSAQENTAWRNIMKRVTDTDAKMMRAFYRLPKSRKDDETWHRKKSALRLMRAYDDQLELARCYYDRKGGMPSDKPKNEIPPEPEDWRSRAMGKFQEPGFSSWYVFYKSYKNEAEGIMKGDDLSS